VAIASVDINPVEKVLEIIVALRQQQYEGVEKQHTRGIYRSVCGLVIRRLDVGRFFPCIFFDLFLAGRSPIIHALGMDLAAAARHDKNFIFMELFVGRRHTQRNPTRTISLPLPPAFKAFSACISMFLDTDESESVFSMAIILSV